MTSRFLAVRGRLQRAGLVVHVLAQSFIDLTPQLARLADGDLLAHPDGVPPDLSNQLALKSRDFH